MSEVMYRNLFKTKMQRRKVYCIFQTLRVILIVILIVICEQQRRRPLSLNFDNFEVARNIGGLQW